VLDSDGLPGVVATGDYRRSLEALRDHLAACLVSVEPSFAAPLARQLSLVLDRLEELPNVERKSASDDLRARRAARRSAASGQ
jgi:hypothetical protein